MTRLFIRIRLALVSLRKILSQPTYSVRAFWYSIGILVILQWSFNIGILVSVAQTQPIELPRFIIDGVIGIIRYNDNFVSFGMIAIALMQGVALAAVKFIKDAGQGTKSGGKASVAVALFGTGCVACGGSIIAPLLASLPATFSVAVSRFVGNVAILLGIILSLYSLISLGQKAARFVNQAGGEK